MIVLTSEQLEQVLTPDIAINAVRQAFSLYSSGKITQPQRQVLTIKGNWWGIMPSFWERSVVIKIVNVIPDNKRRGIAAVQGSVLLFSPETGEPLALLDGTTLTAIRTSAASVLSAELAFDSRNIGNLGVIGAGTEARYHIKLATSYLKYSKVMVTARSSHTQLAKEFGAEAVDLETLLKSSDVIFATTSSSSPVVLGKFLKDDFHVSSIGAHTPESREIDDETIKKTKTFFVDSLEAVGKEAGDYIQPTKAGILKQALEIGEIINKGVKVQRPSVFKTVGIAAQDNITALVAYEEAVKKGIGVKIT
ncbi:ornithine cyclodeaminase family protein [Stygiolobus caldivivus]|uniref:Ornithine cyclodeaminase n=1 Tax=Stygiolobus caldivivus TaxID=2824673 RepID=A0A8D5ZIC2_9CREN|nr:ornithine cyclodeaminase family protein [Stygiolobus caldivivus]BCU69300.1 ornithine cyclodeaminase [Stygiolobus caldivivus]